MANALTVLAATERRLLNAIETIAELRAEKDALALQLQSAQDALAAVIAENTANVAALAEAREELDTATKRAAEFHQMYEPEMAKLKGMYAVLGGPENREARLQLALGFIRDIPPDMTCQEIDEICHMALWDEGVPNG